MPHQEYIVGKGCDASDVFERISQQLDRSSVRISVDEIGNRRSQQQNALLWVLYTEILKKGGEALRGWAKEDLHEMFLIEHFGSDEIRLGKRRRLKPKRRSSKLSKMEFSEFVDFIVRYMAEQGVILKLPGDLE